ncbi:MAG: hypothetical protein HY644_02165 [Acidobacteria bacterium]|nr:hypothetical protein [Acidobacteriota bacterium]
MEGTAQASRGDKVGQIASKGLSSSENRLVTFSFCVLLCFYAAEVIPEAVVAAPERASHPTGPGTTEGQERRDRAGQEAPQLPLVEAIRSDRPEQLFDLLKKGGTALDDRRKRSFEAMAYYRLGDFDAVARLLSKMDPTAAETLFLQSLLRASEGRFQDAEKLISTSLTRRAELGLLAFEAGLHQSYVLQRLGRPKEAAAAIEQFITDVPFGKAALRSIQRSLESAPGKPYVKEAMVEDHTIPLLADGSMPPRTVLSLRPEEPARLVLFDTGSSLTFLKAGTGEDLGTGATALALDLSSNTDFQYGWQGSLTIGGWRMKDIPVGFLDRKSEKSAQLNYEAVFGLPFLRNFFVIFNFPKRNMQLLPRAPEKVEGNPVAFRYVADQIILRATINGKPANLLVDTGLALPSLRVDTSWALVVASPPAENARPNKKTRAAGGRRSDEKPASGNPPQVIPVMHTKVRSLKFGRQEMKNLAVTMDTLQERMKLNPLAVRVDGILAAPLMKDYVVSLDFENNRIYFQRVNNDK